VHAHPPNYLLIIQNLSVTAQLSKTIALIVALPQAEGIHPINGQRCRVYCDRCAQYFTSHRTSRRMLTSWRAIFTHFR